MCRVRVAFGEFTPKKKVFNLSHRDTQPSQPFHQPL